LSIFQTIYNNQSIDEWEAISIRQLFLSIYIYSKPDLRLKHFSVPQLNQSSTR